VQSPDARSLSLEFEPFGLPAGARLYVHDGDGTLVRGPYTAADATKGAHRTPAVKTDEAVVELVVPAGRRSALNLALRTVVHGVRPLRPSAAGGRSKAGACNLDVACDQADPWRRQARAVGSYTYTRDGSSYVCTGALMNNTAGNGRPFFLTAEHCVATPAQAASMVFYWNYQNESCREQGTDENGSETDDNRRDQTSIGALLRARYGNTHATDAISGKPDLTLVEVDDVIPERYDLFFSGWSRTGHSPEASTTVHHPSGDGKRISFDRDPATLIDYPASYTCQAPLGKTHYRVGDWEVGTTEVGSSGSPLYNERQQVVGVLSGGCAGCSGGDGNDQSDWYGRLALGFDNGDYTPPDRATPTTLADWLDPTDSGVSSLRGRPQQAQPVMGPPTGLTATTASGAVQLDWSLPDSVEAAAFRVYRSTAPIDSGIVARSVRRPLARVPGEARTYRDPTAAPDTTYHYRVTALDTAAYEGAFSTAARVSTGPLPVELVAFVGRVDGTTVVLRWRTASETNNAAFRVERNGAPAAEAWNPIGTVDGAGTTTRPQSYRFEDDALPFAADALTYRLRQVDTDGSVVYSETVTIERPASGIELRGPVPNPVRERATVRYGLPDGRPRAVTLRLYDVLGRRVRTIVDARQAGRQTATVDVGGLASGLYLLRLRVNSVRRTQKVTVVR
jgi:lysyl endopeptidase